MSMTVMMMIRSLGGGMVTLLLLVNGPVGEERATPAKVVNTFVIIGGDLLLSLALTWSGYCILSIICDEQRI